MASTSSRSCPLLPQELINYIVVELSGDWRSLEACSLTAKCFRESSQEALFKTLTLYHGSSANTRLDDVMSSNTLLQTYVQTLHLEVSPIQEVIPVLRRFTSLRNLHIESAVSALSFVHWSHFHFDLQQDLLHLIQSRTLDQLILGNIVGFPLDIIGHCSQLKDLQFFLSDWPEVSSVDLPRDEELLTRGHLESLTTNSSTLTAMVMDILTNPRSCLLLSSLKRFNSFVSQPSDRDIVQFQRVLDYAACSLEIISVIVVLDFDFEPMRLDLSGLNNLRVIHINTGDSVAVSLHLAAGMLDTIPKQNKLQEIKFAFAGVYCPSELGQDDSDVSWARLDGILTRSGGHFKISCLLIIMGRSARDDEFRAAILERLPKLHSRRLVEIQFLP